MSFFLRGALVEYGSDVLGPIPNIVVFQFNPEQISRTLNMAHSRSVSSPENARQTESHQTSAPPVESFTLTAQFSAADDLGKAGRQLPFPECSVSVRSWPHSRKWCIRKAVSSAGPSGRLLMPSVMPWAWVVIKGKGPPGQFQGSRRRGSSLSGGHPGYCRLRLNPCRLPNRSLIPC